MRGSGTFNEAKCATLIRVSISYLVTYGKQ